MSKAFHIMLIGAGGIGSRHLQALKGVAQPLAITVVDPSQASLDIAKERHASMPKGAHEHTIQFLSTIPTIPVVDIAFITTCADVRAQVIKNLYRKVSQVRYMVLEKLLFTKKSDYVDIERLLKNKKTKAWVNCPMRMMPVYQDLLPQFSHTPIIYTVTGSLSGLITNAIHYIDHMAYYSGSTDYTVDTTTLRPKPIKSKRKGFLELTGTLTVHFRNGSFGSFTYFTEGSAPLLVEIRSHAYQASVNETANPMPYQSQMTTELTNSLLATGTCQITSYADSKTLHLTLLESLLKFINAGKRKYKEYPFT